MKFTKVYLFREILEFETDESVDPKPKKGRKAYSVQEKAAYILKFLDEKDQGNDLSYETFAESEKVPVSCLFRWVANKEEILRKVYEGSVTKKIRKTSKKNPRHSGTLELLYVEFLKQRKKG